MDARIIEQLFFQYRSTILFVLLIIGLTVFLYRHILKFLKNRHNQKFLSKSGISDIDKMDGHQFEEYLKVLFKKLGYVSSVTKKSGDFGVDLILKKDGKKIAIQAKRYADNVGLKAVQEAYAGAAYYSAEEAWVVTNSNFTSSALDLARKCNVKLVNRSELQKLVLKIQPEKTPKEVRLEVQPKVKKCPACKGELKIRSGKYGKEFYGCSNYPACNYTISLQEAN